MYVSDHLFNPRELESRYTYSKPRGRRTRAGRTETAWPDPMCVISAMAGATENLLFTTGVYIAPLRDLMTVAKSVGTTAVLSDNRLRLGVGVGWSKEEFDQTGQDFATRGKRLDEMIVALRALWRGGWVEFHGDYYDVPGVPDGARPHRAGARSSAAATPPSPCGARPRCATAGSRPAPTARRRRGCTSPSCTTRSRRPGGTRRTSPSTCRSTSGPSVDLYRRFADAGVTDFVCAPWMFVDVDAGHARRRGAGRPARRGALVRRRDRRQGLTALCRHAHAQRSREESHVKTMKIGLQLGYWGSGPPPNAVELVQEADRLGYDSVWTAESYGSDALTPLAWWGSRTERVRLGTSLCQLSARTPTAMAMAALTMDHLSGGRFVLGLGVSGPQVVEGWYGQPFPAPLARTREYVDIVRQVLAREKPVTNDGPHYPLPYPGGTGLGKPLKPIVHPLRADIPIILGRRGTEERRPGGGDRRRLVPHLLLAPGHVLLRGVARRGLRPARAPAAARRTSRCWPSRRP